MLSKNNFFTRKNFCGRVDISKLNAYLPQETKPLPHCRIKDKQAKVV